MEFFALDTNFEVVTPLAPTIVEWNTKYYTFGNFSLVMELKDYTPEMKYIYKENDSRLGEIERLDYSERDGVEQIIIKGYFIEKELDDKIVYPTFYAHGEIVSEITRMISENKGDISTLDIPIPSIQGEKIDFQESYGNLGTVAAEKLKAQEFGQKILYNFIDKRKKYKIYKGKDRSLSQNSLNPVVFSTDFGNIKDIEYMKDWTNEKNFFLIGGSGEGEKRILATYRRDVTEDVKKIQFIDASSITYEPDKQTLEEYRATLVQYGKEKAQEYKVLESINFRTIVSEDSYVLNTDYELGDKCTIEIKNIGVSFDSRIIGINETFKDNIHIVELEMGDTVLSPYQRERMNKV